MKSPSILVPFESYLYLREEMHRQRSERANGRPLLESTVNRLRNQFQTYPDGMRPLMDGDLGGCIGSPVNAYEEHRWTSWRISDMTKMLDAAGLPWKVGPVIEHMAI